MEKRVKTWALVVFEQGFKPCPRCLPIYDCFLISLSFFFYEMKMIIGSVSHKVVSNEKIIQIKFLDSP